ncbi:uncharacterized protein AC631_01615 [Debaryomyces fabryi]|uniref:Uncharacterized protein n=1 Tax=Debaryomyces fabryi TaxID=58627 RepID=A0A0V1Q274_9ASCO|nr:uncharacterized protein AC631_01615 [Debaryomyces fabryi]KSA02628.1 hypothetical protein AC631_01615 [Debaryomyces fabryi]CUM45738.1 unnamed protein product [Debaryomyces fabryi]
MNFFSLFGTSANKTAKIPSFEQGVGHDSADLQVKSLLYVFKRLRLNKLSSFLGNDSTINSFKYVDGDKKIINNSEVDSYFQKLDAMYNVEKFKQVMINDEYRVTIDFTKNKFRSFCILSEYPSKSTLSPQEIGSSEFPGFKDYKDRDVKHFKFSILPLQNTSIAFIANTLSTSDIYAEHHHKIDFNLRYQYAMDSISKVLNMEKKVPDIDSSISISETEKATIIQYYLKRVAFFVQLNRIYEEYLKHHALKGSPTKVSVPASPSKSVSSLLQSYISSNSKLTNSISNLSLAPSPPKLSPRKSMVDLNKSRSSSPTRTLKSKPSVAKMKMDQLFNNSINTAATQTHQLANNTFDSSKSDTSSTTFSKDISLSSPKKLPEVPSEIKLDIWEKCKVAVRDKIEQERKKISSISSGNSLHE